MQDGIDALSDVIYHLETYDVTSVRASTPMYLMSRKIKALGVKMVLSGEGADEMYGGYLYFHKAPNRVEFHKETVRKLKALYQYDCLRANKVDIIHLFFVCLIESGLFMGRYYRLPVHGVWRPVCPS